MIGDPSLFIEILRRAGRVEWHRYTPGTNDKGEVAPPLVVWRFAEPRPQAVLKALRNLAQSTERQVDWMIDTTRKNWVLLPSRIIEVKTRSQPPLTDAQAIRYLMQSDPEFCRRASADFARITAGLADTVC